MTVIREAGPSYFETDLHALYCGWVMGAALKAGLPVHPVTDDEGNHKPELELGWEQPASQNLNRVVVRIRLVIPPPPFDWVMP